MKEDYLLGLDFSGFYIKLSEIKKNSPRNILTNLDYIKTDVNFNDNALYEIITDPDVALHIVSKLTTLFSRNKLSAKNITLTLSALSSILISVPMDIEKSKEERKERALWELSNYYPNINPDSFNIALFPLANDNCNVLLTAIHKDIIIFLRNILNGLGFNIYRFDIDHFAALRATVEGAIEKGRNDYCIVGYRDKYFDIGIIKDSVLNNYYAGLSSDEILNDCEFLKKFLRDKIIEPCYFFGDKFNSEIISDLARTFNIKYYGILDSFQSVDIYPSINVDEKILFNRSDYAFSIGSTIGKI